MPRGSHWLALEEAVVALGLTTVSSGSAEEASAVGAAGGAAAAAGERTARGSHAAAMEFGFGAPSFSFFRAAEASDTSIGLFLTAPAVGGAGVAPGRALKVGLAVGTGAPGGDGAGGADGWILKKRELLRSVAPAGVARAGQRTERGAAPGVRVGGRGRKLRDVIGLDDAGRGGSVLGA